MKNLKYIFMLVFVLSYYTYPDFKNVLDEEINYAYFASYAASSLYNNDVGVATEEKLLVRDYLVVDNRLYIFPLNESVELPIGVMTASVSKNSIEVIDQNYCYYIYNLTAVDTKLYQYTAAFNSLGKTSDFYLIEGNNLDRIISNLEIYYVQV